jgi:membrane protein DedA with SNARE-associated domain
MMTVLQMLQGMLDPLLALVAAGGMEGTGIPWPGAVIVAGAGLTARGGWLSLCLLATAFSASYCLGALAQYGLGRTLGAASLRWLPVAQRHKVTALLAKYGTGAILWTRPLAIGNYVSISAGMVRMPVTKFLFYTLFGIWPWALAMVLIGRLFGARVDTLQETIRPWLLPGILLVSGAALALFAGKLLRQWFQTRTVS